MRGVIQAVFRDHFAAWAGTRALPPHVVKAARALSTCRRAERGYHYVACPEGHVAHKVYNACRTRCCPLCAFMQAERWARKQFAKLLDCDYHHVIFTTAHELHGLWQANRERYAQLLFTAAWQTLQELLADEKYLGALPGAVAALHTWEGHLLPHVHLHLLVTAGGLDAAGQWREPRKGPRLLPQGVVAQKFRGKFLAFLRAGIEAGTLVAPPEQSRESLLTLLNRLDKRRKASKKWHVQIMPRYAHGRGVVFYLARYVRGGPIGEQRILGYDGRELRLLDKHGRPFTLDAGEFLQRFLTHVPPAGMHVVRVFGLFHHAKRALLNRARALKGQLPFEETREPTWTELCAGRFPEPLRCPVCGRPLITVAVWAPRVPPLAHAAPRAPPPSAQEAA